MLRDSEVLWKVMISEVMALSGCDKRNAVSGLKHLYKKALAEQSKKRRQKISRLAKKERKERKKDVTAWWKRFYKS